MIRLFERNLYSLVHGRKPPRRPGRDRNRIQLAHLISYIQWPERDEDYTDWIRQQPSVVSGRYGCEAAHTGTDGGKGLKASDNTCVPLTPQEHFLYHQIGRNAFEKRFCIDFRAHCARLNAEYERSL